MIMGLGRTCYRTEFHPWRNAGPPVVIRWYRAKKTAKVFPGFHIFNSLNWDFAPWELGPPGEVYDAPRKWFNGATPPTAAGQHYFGRAEDFLKGAIYSPLLPIVPRDPWGLALGCGTSINPVGGGEVESVVGIRKEEPRAEEMDSAGLDPRVTRGGDVDSGGYSRFDWLYGGEVDSGTDPGYATFHTACTPAFAPRQLIAVVEDTNPGHALSGGYLMTLGRVAPDVWDFRGSDFSAPWALELFCQSIINQWTLLLRTPLGSVFTNVAIGTAAPFKVGVFVLVLPSLGALPIKVIVRQPSTSLRDHTGGGDVDSGEAGAPLNFPKVEVDSGRLSRFDWLYSGEVDGSEITRHDFAFSAEVDGGGEGQTHPTRGGDVDSALTRNTVRAEGGDTDNAFPYEEQPAVIVGCSPPFLPTNLYVDVTNPNPLGPASGTYPLRYGFFGGGVFDHVWTEGVNSEVVFFYCQSPLNVWRCVLDDGEFAPGQNLPFGTAPPFRCGPFSLPAISWGPSNVTLLFHS